MIRINRRLGGLDRDYTGILIWSIQFSCGQVIGWSIWKKWMKRLVLRIVTRWMGEINGYFFLSKGKSSINALVTFYRKLPMVRKDTSFGVIYQKLLVGWQLLNYEEMFVETPIYIKVCFDHYRPFYRYACHWIVLYYTTAFISWMFIWVLTYIYPLQVCGILLTRFKEFSTFCPRYFIDLLVKSTDNLWKICRLIDKFNDSRRHIASGVEKLQMSQWVPYNFLPPLKDIYRTNPFFRETEPLGIYMNNMAR